MTEYQYQIYSFSVTWPNSKIVTLTLNHIGLRVNKPKDMGGGSNLDLVLDEKDHTPKAQPSTFKIVALCSFCKFDISGKN